MFFPVLFVCFSLPLYPFFFHLLILMFVCFSFFDFFVCFFVVFCLIVSFLPFSLVKIESRCNRLVIESHLDGSRASITITIARNYNVRS